jgi:hypothetical protein
MCRSPVLNDQQPILGPETAVQRDELGAVGIRQISRSLRSRVSAIGAAKTGVNS